MAKIVALTKNVKGLTLNELVSRFALGNEADGKSPCTVRWYTEILTSFACYIKTTVGSNGISIFTISVVRDYILYLRRKPRFEGHPYTPKQDKLISPRTVQCHVRSLKVFSAWLHSEGYTKTNILINLKLPKAPAIIIEPISNNEIRTIFNSIKMKSPTGARNHALLETMLDTGLRVSEVANITLIGLNLQDGYIKVMGKGSKERIVPIGKHVQMTLFSYIDKIRPQPDMPDCNHLFLSRSGKPITPNAIKLVFSRLAKKSGINRLHAHLCRHTFAINYLLNGGDIFSLKEILGHTTLDMVNHYLHFTSAQIVVQHHKYSPMDKLLMNTESSSHARDLVLTP